MCLQERDQDYKSMVMHWDRLALVWDKWAEYYSTITLFHILNHRLVNCQICIWPSRISLISAIYMMWIFYTKPTKTQTLSLQCEWDIMDWILLRLFSGTQFPSNYIGPFCSWAILTLMVLEGNSPSLPQILSPNFYKQCSITICLLSFL